MPMKPRLAFLSDLCIYLLSAGVGGRRDGSRAEGKEGEEESTQSRKIPSSRHHWRLSQEEEEEEK
jgi:hypothetical protein